MGSGSACTERTGTSRSCPSRARARQVAGRHVVGQPDAVGGLVESVAGRVHGRSVHRQDDGRLAARAHLGRRGGGRTRLTRTSRGTPPPSPHPSPAPGRAREFGGHIATRLSWKGSYAGAESSSTWRDGGTRTG